MTPARDELERLQREIARLRRACLGCALAWPLVGAMHVDGITRTACLFERAS
jgi:hypothetical protein